MKELSIEQKAKAYDEALERARKINSGEGVEAPPDWTTCEVIFPELKESEDEKIRKLLIEAVIQVLQDQYCSNRGVSKEKVVAWLEKQGEKPQGKPALEAVKEEKVDNANKIEPKDYSSIDPHFGKLIDKVEPKFNVGDKVYNIKNRFESTIESIDDTTYYCDTTNFDIKDQNNWELVEQKSADKVEPKFEIEEEKWYTLGPICYL